MAVVKTKKILCIVHLPPPLHGATIMNSHVINSEILNRNFYLDILNLQFAGSIKELGKFSLLKVFKAFFYGFEIIKRAVAKRPDLVYFTLSPTGYAFYRDLIYVSLLKLFNIKIVFHLHGKGIKNNAQSNLLKKYLYLLIFKNVKVICLSDSLTSDISELYKFKPFIIPNGIQVNQNSNKTIHKTNNIPQVLYLSNYKRDKGILVLVEALKILKDQGYEYNARIVGAPSDLTVEMLEGIIINHNLEAFIKVNGPLYGDDKVLEFQMADIFVFPTYYKNEAFPLVILEAMKYSLPVISTFEGGIPEMVIDGRTGFLVEPQNAQMLAEKICILLKDKDLIKKMGHEGYKRFINNYTLIHFEKNLNKTFQSILGIN